MALNYDSPLIDNTTGSPTLDSLKSGSDKINGALTEIKEEVGDLYGRDSILGTVSETAGVPTGAIIESGSNSEGEYTKFADGTMTQFGTITLSVPFTQEEGGFYRNIATDLRITLPQTFSGAIADYAASVYVGGAAFQSDAGEIIGLQQIEHESTGELKVLFINQTSNTATLTFGFSAIGRWFN